MFPPELLTFGLTTALGGAMTGIGRVLDLADKHQKNQVEIKMIEKNMEIKAATAVSKLADAASMRGGPWVKRMLACVCAFILLSPVLIPIIDKAIPVTYLYDQGTRPFLWGIFGGSIGELKSQTFTGLVFLPIHSHTCMAIVGFYFGAGAIKK